MNRDELKMELIRVIRANLDKSKRQIKNLVKQHLPDVPMSEIAEALQELADETK